MKYKVIGKEYSNVMCFVCGVHNEAGLQARFYHCQREDGKHVLLTIFNPKECHQSYPGRMHGGVIGAVLDEAIGRAMQIIHPEVWAVTTELTVKYRKPVPLDQTLYVEGSITTETSRTFDAEGKLFLGDGTVCATAVGRYFKCTAEQIGGGNPMTAKDWHHLPEDLPEEITIGS